MTLDYLVNHVFLPPKLPQERDLEASEERSVVKTVHAHIVRYQKTFPSVSSQWAGAKKMVEKLERSYDHGKLSEDVVQTQLSGMRLEDTLVYHIRSQNAGLVVTKRSSDVLFESFEVSPMAGPVMQCAGRLIWSFPGPAVSVPNNNAENESFQHELSVFLARMDADTLDATPTTRKAQSEVVEERDTTDPRYIIQLLTGILRGHGQAAEVVRITKRVADDVLWNNTKLPWRRSPVWLLVRVSLQLVMRRTTGDDTEYKRFILSFMASLTNEAVEGKFSSEMLSCMRSKLSRRLSKISSTVPESLTTTILATAGRVEALLQNRWLAVQEAHKTPPLWQPSTLQIERDTTLSLNNSRKHLTLAMEATASHNSPPTFTPSHPPRYPAFGSYLSGARCILSSFTDKERRRTLADFEKAVENGLEDCRGAVSDIETACVALADSIGQYTTLASSTYAHNPELTSVMILTAFELWVTLDRLTVKQHPLLAEYSPDIPLHIFRSLLLPKVKEQHRLRRIIAYVSGRITSNGASIFSSTHNTSFSVRYAQESILHQDLRARIRADATRERATKRAELQRLNEEHRQLERDARYLAHEYWINSRGNQQHLGRCRKCGLEERARSMSISLHEWPLPTKEDDEWAAVFELHCPPAFHAWREATYGLLHNTCMPEKLSGGNEAQAFTTIGDYAGLRSYWVTPRSRTNRLVWASSTKSFTVAHYRTTSIPANDSQVCVNNGLTLALYDSGATSWVTALPSSRFDISRQCAYALPSGPYHVLEHTVRGTAHTSNDIQASQVDCSKELVIHEFIAYGTLRSGGRLQWMNILRELRSRTLTYRTREVHFLIAQAASQVGPIPLSSDGPFEWHEELEVPTFALALLPELESLLSTIRGNWMETTTMVTIVFLANRLLTVLPAGDLANNVCALLRAARAASFLWIVELARKLQECADEEVEAFQARIREACVACRMTYDADARHLATVLESKDDLRVLFRAAITLHDNTPPQSPSLDVLQDRDERLALALESHVADMVSRDSAGLDAAIGEVWSSYRPGTGWTRLATPNERWVTSRTATRGGSLSQVVHYNLLSGELLVDGKPVGRLPEEVMKHPLYVSILGQKMLDVIPADLPGMEFASRLPVEGHQLFFARRAGGILVHAMRGDRRLELIPAQVFAGDLVQTLVDDHIHWLDLRSGEIEFRPMPEKWVPSISHPHLYFHALRGFRSIMRLGDHSSVIDIRSPTHRMVSATLAALDHPHFIQTVLSANSQVDVVLPRYGLSFFINNKKELQSVNYEGLVVDHLDQSTGTMIGLRNQLVLRPADRAADKHPRPRSVLIPRGALQFHVEGDHVHVTVDIASMTRVPFNRYEIDSNLDCLVGTVSLVGSLYQAYLHAVTSHCLPDPLTGRTGTEQSLLELTAARCKSFQTLGEAEQTILKSLSALSPSRQFYPQHLQVMQQVEWTDLPFLSQHPAFVSIVESIWAYARRVQVFHSEDTEFPPSSNNTHLLQRSLNRTRAFWPVALSTIEALDGAQASHATTHPPTQDVQYHARHASDRLASQGDHHGDEASICALVAMVHARPERFNTCEDLWAVLSSWRQIDGRGVPDTLIPHYDRRWLNPGLAESWLSIYDLCRGGTLNSYQLVFILAAMSYGNPDCNPLLPTLLAFASVSTFSSCHPPTHLAYTPSDGLAPASNKIEGSIRRHQNTFERSAESSLPAQYRESEVDAGRRKYALFERNVRRETEELVQFFLDQWRCASPRSPSRSYSDHFDLSSIMNDVTPLFASWYRNYELREHVREVQAILNSVHTPSPITPRAYSSSYPSLPTTGRCSSTSPNRNILQLLGTTSSLPIDDPPEALSFASFDIMLRSDERTNDHSALEALVASFRSSSDRFQSHYGGKLDRSLSTLKAQNERTAVSHASDALFSAKLASHHDSLSRFYSSARAVLRQHLSPRVDSDSVAMLAGHWPRLGPTALMSLLTTRGALQNLPYKWRQTLITLAKSLIVLQRSQRLLRFADKNLVDDLYRELQNTPDWASWDLESRPEWLLIQIEGHFLVRPVQVDVANRMLKPDSKDNIALQLNMGEGKSAVIVPLAAANLADGTKFVRVVVLKPLASQMFQLLVERLGGLANRRVFFFPFSRSLKLDSDRAKIIQDLYEECKRVRGIVIAQPDHILSFKLMAIDQHLSLEGSDQTQLTDQLLASQEWLAHHARDILDECDEILHVRYQLIYTVGTQQHLEHHPDRWTTVQQLFRLAVDRVGDVQKIYPEGIEIKKDADDANGAFPIIRVLDSAAGRELVSRITAAIVQGKLANYPLSQVSTAMCNEIATFISVVDLPAGLGKRVEAYCKGTALWNGLLLLRGYIAHGILLYVFQQRRWRVDYGLDPSRTMLAVPYRAKDVPAPRAEFGHPDVAVALTTLSYYHGGITDAQFQLCLRLLYKQDNPELEYETWARACPTIPAELCRLAGVNVRSAEQRTSVLLPLFRRNPEVVNFYLSQVVFPKEAKEFPSKLSASGWDIAERRTHLTTGFSGTNDNRYLLPTSITQQDPEHQLSTNARVLSFLLRPENQHYACAESGGQRLTAREFLELLVQQEPEIRVLLDVGAEMLELQNRELVSQWLALKPDALAAVYVDERDHLMVLARDGTVEPLISSPFNQRLGSCILYLDDAHTRGVDVKLPRGMRAAVTLGPKMTKDRLVQGCMRMRKLGDGHALMLFAPMEVDRTIRTLVGKTNGEPIQVEDVLRWVMLETCHDITRRAHQWAEQAVDYRRRSEAWSLYSQGASLASDLASDLAEAWQRPEAMTLEQMYRDAPATRTVTVLDSDIKDRLQKLGVDELEDTRMTEEQEREVSHEIEREQQIERPPRATPAQHSVHAALVTFVRTGAIPSGSSDVFKPAFSRLGSQKAPQHADVWSSRLRASHDYLTTIILGRLDSDIDYQRPVHWVLSTKSSQVLVIVSPYEADELLPAIRASEKVRLHMYTARVTESMRPCDDLQLYCVPPLRTTWMPLPAIIRELNLFAGQLYINDLKTYEDLCLFLGLNTSSLRSRTDVGHIESDGFIPPSSRPSDLRELSPFKTTPLPFVRELIGVRRKGMGYLVTHMGQVLRGRFLTSEDWKPVETNA